MVRPWNNPQRDIARKLKVQPELFLVGVIDSVVVATVMAGYEGHRGWINYLAVSPDKRRQGLGREMMEEVEKRLCSVGCPKINLLVRTENADVLEFYNRLGYARDDAISMGKRLETI